MMEEPVEVVVPPAKNHYAAAENITLYLAHPYEERVMGKKIQAYLEGKGFTVVNPFDRSEQLNYDQHIENNRLTDEQCASIVTHDLLQIDDADAVVAVGVRAPSIGTSMEVFYASNVLRKPVFFLDLSGKGTFAKHPWIRRLTFINPNMNDMVAAIEGWRKARG